MIKLLVEEFSGARRELMLQSQVENKKIYLQKKTGGLYFADFFECVDLEEEAIQHVVMFLPCCKKYEHEVPRNVKELIVFSGGLQKTERRLKSALRFIKAVGRVTDVVCSYLDRLLVELSQLRFISAKKYVSKTIQTFCCLCHREVSSRSKSYCIFHTVKLNYQRDKLKLLSFIRNNSNEYSEEVKSRNQKGLGIYPARLSKYLDSVSVKPDPQVFDFSKLQGLWLVSWKEYAKALMGTIQLHYPLSYSLLKKIKIEDFDNWLSFANALRLRLDRDHFQHSTHKDWLKYENNADDARLLLAVVARFNSFLVLREYSAPRGPKKGDVMGNMPLKAEILNMMNHQRTVKGNVNLSEIARAIGISRQRASYLVKNDSYFNSKQASKQSSKL